MFYQSLQNTTDNVKYKEKIIVCDDFNGHTGCRRRNLEHFIGSFSVGDENSGEEIFIEYALVNGSFIINNFYKRRDSHKWTYYGWNEARQEYTGRSMIACF